MITTKRYISLDGLIKGSIFSYFAISFVYYLNFLPLGHLINVVYSSVFALLAYLDRGRIACSLRETLMLVAIVVLFVVSILSWVLRDAWDIGGAVRTVSWVTPIALMVLLLKVRSIDHSWICSRVALVGLLVNVVVTVGIADFDAELGKFVVNASWTWVSSNELSFHLVSFGVLFFGLARSAISVGAAWILVIGSMIHLSKAHIVALAGGGVASISGRRFWSTTGVIVVLAIAARWMFAADLIGSMDVPSGFERVFVPFLDAMTLLSSAVSSGSFIQLDALGEAVGVYRFEVYVSAFDMMANGPVGLPQESVTAGLQGLDPHSNLLYLGLREGWFVLAAFLFSTLLVIGSLPVVDMRGRLVFALLVYIFIRGLFLTFDPVKLLTLGIYCFFALSATSSRENVRGSDADSRAENVEQVV
jgi:hypothetical protein